MALIKCKECGKEISDQAPTCPGCGAPKHIAQGLPEAWTASEPAQTPQPSQQIKPSAPAIAAAPQKKTSGCAAILIIAVLIAFGVIASRCSSSEDSSPATGNNQAATSTSTGTVNAPPPDLAKQLQDENVSASNRLGIAQALIRSYPGTPEAQMASTLLPKIQEEISTPPVGSQWMYNSYQDDMSSKSILTATVASTNTFEFDFPYQGAQHATLRLRKHPRWGNDVILSIEKGQILCHTYECPVRVRFDEAPPQTFNGNEPDDNSSEYVFIPGYAGFIKKLKHAKRVRIEVNIFQEGNLVADFNVEGFNPDRLNEGAR
jgi:hypothetical protein